MWLETYYHLVFYDIKTKFVPELDNENRFIDLAFLLDLIVCLNEWSICCQDENQLMDPLQTLTAFRWHLTPVKATVVEILIHWLHAVLWEEDGTLVFLLDFQNISYSPRNYQYLGLFDSIFSQLKYIPCQFSNRCQVFPNCIALQSDIQI